MAVTFVVLLFCMNSLVKSYENLCRRPTTTVTQSSLYAGFVYNTAYLANDGVLNTTERHCSHTAPNNPTAWLQVDLGRLYRIKSVKIYYRRDGDRDKDWKQYRFRQFYLDVSNLPVTETTTAERTRCYTDNTTAPHLPPNIVDIPCKHTTRYVIVETHYDAPEDDPFIGAILEICEIEVYGCDDDRYGSSCSVCPGCSTCDIITGACDCNTNCKDNLCRNLSGHCLHGCNAGYWGSTCSNECTENCVLKICTNENGTCQKCKTGYWGGVCSERCSKYCSEDECDQENGTCSAGCTEKWTGLRCEIPYIQDTDNSVIIYAAIASLCLILIAVAVGLFLRCKVLIPKSQESPENMDELSTVAEMQVSAVNPKTIEATKIYQQLEDTAYTTLYD